MTAAGAEARTGLLRSIGLGGRAGVWFGIVAGFLEVLLLGLRRFGFGQPLWLGGDVVWMAPCADAVLLGLLGLAVGAIAGVLPPAGGARLRAFVLAFPAGWTVALALAAIDERAALILALGLAIQLARQAGRQPAAWERLVRRTLPALLLCLGVLGLATTGWTRWAERRRVAALPPAAGVPNVLLLILDTVRALDLSAYGYTRPTSPHITALAREGVQFDRAFAAAPWTLPSHASLFGGRYADAWDLHWLTPLHRRFPTLAGVLRQRGYATGGFVGNQFYGNPEFGLARGFIHYEVYPLTWMEVLLNSALGRRWINSRRVRSLMGNWDIANRMRAPRVNAGFLSWLDGLGDRPFFAFLNYFDAHEPYLPPPPFDTLFGRPPRVQPATVFALRNADLLREDRRRLSPEELREQRDAYDGSIASVDAAVGELLAELERRGLLDHTVVVLTADHGEALGEEGRFLHGFDLSAPVLGVPLVIRYPAGAVPRGLHVATEVSLRDVAATILDLAGEGEGARLPGASLARLWTGGAAPDVRAASLPFSSFLAPNGRDGGHAIVRGRYHFIRRNDGREQLFDLAADPLETRDLVETEEGRRLSPELRATLDSLRAGDGGR